MQSVKMYTTAVCPYCIRAKQLLKAKGVEQKIYVGETHVGGCDDLMALDAKGGLLPLLQSA